MVRRTVLNAAHRRAGARLVEFAGFELPLHYGSQLREHQAVRCDSGMFDVSHMAIFDLAGVGARSLLRRLLANDVDRLQQPGRALYSCMLNESGGVLDDLMVYRLTDPAADGTAAERDAPSPDHSVRPRPPAGVGVAEALPGTAASGSPQYRLIANAATRDSLGPWLAAQAEAAGVTLVTRDELALIAVQGPHARRRVLEILPPALAAAAAALPRFGAVQRGDWFVARTGYTGEDGFELALPEAAAPGWWERLAAAGVTPCGLGARDTLRLEAGLRLYGLDLDPSHTPLESGLGWTVAWTPEERDFIGRDALRRQLATGDIPRFVGLVLEADGVMRPGQRVWVGEHGLGLVTSGTFSPCLRRSIGFARLPPGADSDCHVEIRGALLPARITSTRFLRLLPGGSGGGGTSFQT